MKNLKAIIIAVVSAVVVAGVCVAGYCINKGKSDTDDTKTTTESDSEISLSSYDGVVVQSAGSVTGENANATLVGDGAELLYDEELKTNVLYLSEGAYLNLPANLFASSDITGITVAFRVCPDEECADDANIFQTNIPGYSEGDTAWYDAPEVSIKVSLRSVIYAGGRTINGTYNAAATYNNGVSGVDDTAYAEPEGHKTRYSATTESSLSKGEYSDVVMTIGSNGLNVYVNGELVTYTDEDENFDLSSTIEYLFSTDDDGDLIIADYLFNSIGNSVYSDTSAFVGCIDDITIYTREISESEVSAAIGNTEADYVYNFSNSTVVVPEDAYVSDLTKYNDKTDVTKVSDLSLESPSGDVVVDFYKDESDNYYYSVQRDGVVIVEVSALGLELDGYSLKSKMTYSDVTTNTINEEFYLPTGCDSESINYCNEMQVKFTNDDGSYTLYVRAYDEGMALKYVDVTVADAETVTVTYEYTNVDLPDTAITEAFEICGTYESEYVTRTMATIKRSSITLSAPVYADVNGYSVLITEAAVYNNDGEYASSGLKCGEILTWTPGLARDPDDEAKSILDSPGHIDLVEFDTVNGFSTPWRAVIVSNDTEEFVTTDMIAALNDDPDEELFADTSWILPGSVAWSWWAEDGEQANYDKHIEYIDFAAENGWDYVTLDANWRYFEERLAEMCEYAESKGVGIFVWVNYYEIDTEEERYELLSSWAEAGVKGIKADYYESDEPEVLYAMQRTAEVAAEYKLMVIFHGCIRPGGETRTYPNVISYEAVQGEENHKWSSVPTVENCLIYPFTRNIVGPMDYTPICMPSGNGETAGFAIAKAIVYETGLPHFASAASIYSKWNGLSLLNNIEVAWDDTTVYEGSIGEYISLMRQAGDKYYIGAMTLEARTVTYDLSFLPDGEYYAYIYEDAEDGSALLISRITVTSADTLTYDLLANGGIAIMITKDDIDIDAYGDDSVDMTDYTFIEAEASTNKRSGAAVISNAPMCSGVKKVGYIGNGANNTLTFNINVDTAGTYEIVLYYCTGEDRTVYVSTNGGEEVAVETPNSGGWNIASTVTFTVTLNEGDNTITLGNSSYYAPDIDRLAYKLQ